MRRVVDRIVRRLPARHRPAILMYHRVAARDLDPWGLAVHPDRFRAQMQFLARRRTPLAMSEMVRRLRDGTLPRRAVAVTFDDGYVDNLRTALPVLEAAGVPATVFLVAAAIGQPTEFWWDEVARGMLGRRDALDCEIPIGGTTYHLCLSAEDLDDGCREDQWRAWQEPRNARQRTFLGFWRRLRDATARERDDALRWFREAADLPGAAPTDVPMTLDEVVQIARTGLVEIGGHTLTHPFLPGLSPAERRWEIVEGKRRCEELTGREISGFAYPHGGMNDDCRAAVEECGFLWACGTATGFVRRAADVYALPRLFVQDWDVARLEAALT